MSTWNLDAHLNTLASPRTWSPITLTPADKTLIKQLIIFFKKVNHSQRASGMAPQLKALVDVSEILSSIPSKCMVAYNHL